MNVGIKIKELRKKSNMTQEDLASKLFVTRNAVSKWETNKGLPNIDNLKELSNIFNVSIDLFINEEEIIDMVLDNKKRLEYYTDIVISIGLLLTYSLNGILIPYISFSLDYFGDPVVNYIIMPLFYILLGITAQLRMMKPKFVVVTSVIALTPIYVMYDILLPTKILGVLGLIYLVIFLFVYFIMRVVIEKLINTFELSKLNKVFVVISLLTIVIYIIHTVTASINLYNCIECSAPWTLALVMNTILYAIPITITSTLSFYFHKLNGNA